jgi:uncharacterized protein
MANRLINETSPYLLQHAHNPVDWFPWGEEAFAEARAHDKPIILSIGYSACHWCHVMERESFEDEGTAELMNERFVSIKVDREERPDLDQIYMTAVQGLTGHGGWPMTVFLTPDGKPFYGGTYFPPNDRGGMPSFQRVLTSVSDAYHADRGQVEVQAERVTEFVRQQVESSSPADSLSPGIMDDAFAALTRQFDQQHGGFGTAPKFPPAMALEFLLRYLLRTGEQDGRVMVDSTLVHMATGGIYDQIGGGFHRYSVDDRWLVPHFEKMLYDNALLARAYLHAHQVTGAPFYRRIVEETLDYVRREMLDDSGGFYSTLDADSEGVEGKYYVWTGTEFDEVVGDDAPILRDYFGVTDPGNFEGQNILTLSTEPEGIAVRHGRSPEQLAEVVARGQAHLLEAREGRVRPGLDDKILSAWNGLMLRSFAEAARALGRDEDRQTAVQNAAFLVDEMWRAGTLYRVYKQGDVRIAGCLEDYAAVADALLAVYELTFDLRWFTAARDIAAAMVDRFWDEERGTFYDSPRDGEPLVVRPRDTWDNATPSGTSLACQALLRLWSLTDEPRYEAIVQTTLQGLGESMRQLASGMGNLLCALDFYLAPPQNVAIIGDPNADDTAALVAPLHARFLPNAVTALGHPENAEASLAIPLLAARPMIQERATAYVCRGFTCELPTTDPATMLAQLGQVG